MNDEIDEGVSAEFTDDSHLFRDREIHSRQEFTLPDGLIDYPSQEPSTRTQNARADTHCTNCDRTFKTSKGLGNHKRACQPMSGHPILVTDSEPITDVNQNGDQNGNTLQNVTATTTTTSSQASTCDICGKEFKNARALTSHKRVHKKSQATTQTQNSFACNTFPWQNVLIFQGSCNTLERQYMCPRYIGKTNSGSK